MKQEEYTERAVLAGVEVMGDGKEGDLDRSMEELGNLAKACFMEPVAVVTQRMESVHKGLYMGKGKMHVFCFFQSFLKPALPGHIQIGF